MIRGLIEEVHAPDQHVLDPVRQLPPGDVHDFGLDRGVVRGEGALEVAVDRREVHDARRFGAVVPDQVIRGGRREPDFPGALAERVQLGGLSTRERLLIGPGGAGAHRHAAPGEIGEHPIHDLGGHHPMGGELAARDRDHAAAAGHDRMLPGSAGGRASVSGGQQRAQPGPGRAHVVHAQACIGELGVDRAQQVDHIVGRGGGRVGRLGGIGIGGSDVGEIAPRQREHHSPVDRAQEGDRLAVSEAIAGNDDVHALRRPEQRLAAGLLEGPQPVDPGSRGIHHRRRVDGRARAAQPVDDPHPDHPLGGPFEVLDRRVRGDDRAVSAGGTRGRQDQPRVVALGVEVAGAAEQAALADRGLELEEGALAQHAVRGHIAEQRQQVVGPHAGRETPEREPVTTMQGEDERKRSDEVGRDAEEDAPLPVRFPHQPELALLEIPEAAMDQPARPGARAGGEITLLDEHGGKAPHRGVPGDPRPGDAATDDQQIERPGAQRVERRPA